MRVTLFLHLAIDRKCTRIQAQLSPAIKNGKYANILYPEPGLMASLAYRKTWTIEILSIIFKQTSIYSDNIHFRYFKKKRLQRYVQSLSYP
jgi:hypothetical protein